MQKYLCYSVDDFGHRQAAMYERDNDGDWYLASDVDEQLQNLATHLRDAMLSEDALKAHIQRQDAKIAELEKALRSIANSTCCDGCQEAKLVATNVLGERRT